MEQHFLVETVALEVVAGAAPAVAFPFASEAAAFGVVLASAAAEAAFAAFPFAFEAAAEAAFAFPFACGAAASVPEVVHHFDSSWMNYALAGSWSVNLAFLVQRYLSGSTSTGQETTCQLRHPSFLRCRLDMPSMALSLQTLRIAAGKDRA